LHLRTRPNTTKKVTRFIHYRRVIRVPILSFKFNRDLGRSPILLGQRLKDILVHSPPPPLPPKGIVVVLPGLFIVIPAGDFPGTRGIFAQ